LVDEDGALDKIRAAVGNGRVQLAIDGVAGKSGVTLVASGAIQVPIAATYPLSSLREAVLHAQRGGKVLLDLRGTT
jgi:hypothetical protein